MTYDIRLFKPRPDEDPLITAQREDDEEPSLSELDLVQEAIKQRIVTALISTNSALQPLWPNYQDIAARENISIEAIKLKHRWVQLDERGSQQGIQILLFDGEASISVPYWHDGAQAEDVFRRIWNYLRVINRESGYMAYDPQLGILLDLSQDFSAALHLYTGTRKAVAEQMPGIELGTSQPKSQKKWWQFWKT
jgi:hypothetical protein